MTAKISIKRGDTFSLACEALADPDVPTPRNLTNVNIVAKMRRPMRDDIIILTAAKTDAVNGLFTLSATAAQTALWATGVWFMDIQYDQAGVKDSTETVQIDVVEDYS